MTIADDFKVQHARAREIFTILPPAIVDAAEPPPGYDGYFDGIVQGTAHVRMSSTYTPSPPVTWQHRYLHESGHILHAQLRLMGLTENYLYTRHWAYRFKGSAAAPPTWQDQRSSAWQWGALGEWGHTPAEMWAEDFVIAVMGIIEKERTATYDLTIDASATRRFFVDLMHEVAPVTYPTPPGEALIAKAADDSLFLFQTTDMPAKIRARNGAFARLGDVAKWW
jgi:hypothetical protein